jgi:hypothetical protein
MYCSMTVYAVRTPHSSASRNPPHVSSVVEHEAGAPLTGASPAAPRGIIGFRMGPVRSGGVILYRVSFIGWTCEAASPGSPRPLTWPRRLRAMSLVFLAPVSAEIVGQVANLRRAGSPPRTPRKQVPPAPVATGAQEATTDSGSPGGENQVTLGGFVCVLPIAQFFSASRYG